MNLNFNERPMVVIWEMTRACDLACVHCRASAQPQRNCDELSTLEAQHLIHEVAEMQAPIFVMTGGDPMKRPDIYELVDYARRKRVNVSLTPSATPLLTRDAIFELKRCGLCRLAVSLDGSTPEIHDAFRGVPGSYARTIDAIHWAHDAHLPIQINTTITRRNVHDLEALAKVIEDNRTVLWSCFFLIPTGRGQVADLLAGEEVEEVFARLYAISKRVRFHIKTTEGQHYRRYVLQQKAKERAAGMELEGAPDPDMVGAPPHIARLISRARQGVNDGKGFVFVSHVGDVYPSGFFPLSGGNVRETPLREIYRNSPLFVGLRDTALLEGKCGKCEFKEICGGSRARAYALTGNMFAEEYGCIYQPGGEGVAQFVAQMTHA